MTHWKSDDPVEVQLRALAWENEQLRDENKELKSQLSDVKGTLTKVGIAVVGSTIAFALTVFGWLAQ
jgi:cell division septum initiation protein DivIVA